MIKGRHEWDQPRAQLCQIASSKRAALSSISPKHSCVTLFAAAFWARFSGGQVRCQAVLSAGFFAAPSLQLRFCSVVFASGALAPEPSWAALFSQGPSTSLCCRLFDLGSCGRRGQIFASRLRPAANASEASRCLRLPRRRRVAAWIFLHPRRARRPACRYCSRANFVKAIWSADFTIFHRRSQRVLCCLQTDYSARRHSRACRLSSGRHSFIATADHAHTLGLADNGRLSKQHGSLLDPPRSQRNNATTTSSGPPHNQTESLTPGSLSSSFRDKTNCVIAQLCGIPWFAILTSSSPR